MLGLGCYLLAATALSKQGLSVCSAGSEQHGRRRPLLDEAGAETWTEDDMEKRRGGPGSEIRCPKRAYGMS